MLLNPIWSLSPDLLFTKSDLRKDSKEKKKFHYVLKPEFLDFIVDAKIICYPALLPSQGLLRMNRRLVWSPTEDILMAQEYIEKGLLLILSNFLKYEDVEKSQKKI